MKRMIDVHTGEVMAGQGDVVLKSDTNNACMVIVAYDALHKIGGLAHALFRGNNGGASLHAHALREASYAIDEMVKDMTLLGSETADIEVELVTGENVPHEKNDPNFKESLALALDLIQRKNMRLRKDTVEDVGRSHVSLDVSNGSISYL